MMETHTHSAEDTQHRQIDVLHDLITNGTTKIPALLGRTVEYKDSSFRIDKVETPNHRLYLAVTFVKPPADSIQSFITITDPLVLVPDETRSDDDEKQVLLQALYDMLERFS